MPSTLNDIATVLALVLSLIATFYTVVDIRRKVGKPEIKGVKDSHYYPFNDETGRTARFSCTAVLANRGRELVVFKSVSAYFQDYNEELSLSGSDGEQRIELDPNDERDVYLWANPPFDIDPTKSISGELRAETSKGHVAESVTFDL